MIPEPYEGQEAYIFISYAHRDKEQVFQVLNTLQEQGYRFWYDDGIAPGSEWPEDIGRHLDQASMVIAFVTPLSMASTNCRREINFALAREKPFLSVILEPTNMPVGMELQLSSQRSVVRYNYPNWESFMNKILSCPTLAPCKIPDAVPATRTAPPAPAGEASAETPGAPQPAAAETKEKPPEPKKDRRREKKPLPEAERSAKREKTRGKKPLLKRPLFWILAVILALALVLFLPHGGGTTPKISGFSWGSTDYLNGRMNLYGKTFSQEDLKKIAVLSDLKSLSLRSCDLSACDFGDLSLATAELETFELEDTVGVNDFRFLEGQPLRRLNLSGCAAFTDLSKLDCSGIYSLYLAGTGVEDLSALRGAPLSTLVISNTRVSDLSPLADCSKLAVLEAENCPIGSIDALAELKSLTNLNCSGCPIGAVRKEFLSLSMTGLQMANCGAADLSGFADFTTLKTLNLGGNPGLESLDWLHEKNCASLESLDLSYTGVKAEDLAFLAGCTALKELTLSGIELENLDFCASMAELTMIRAEGCGLQDISRLPCAKLQKLLLAFNQIREVYCLKDLDLSTEVIVDLSFNQLETVSVLPEGKYAALLLNGNSDKLPATLPPGLEGRVLSLSWSEGIQEKLQIKKGAFVNLYMTDCPATEILDLQKALGSGYLKTVTTDELMELLAEGRIHRSLQTGYTALLPLFRETAT